jgi:hypothetical protein
MVKSIDQGGGMSAQRPSKQPHLFTSALSHASISVHIVFGVRGWLFAFATHAFA